MYSTCSANVLAPLASMLALGSSTLCGCSFCVGLPEDELFVEGFVFVVRAPVLDCPDLSVTRGHSPIRLPDTGTGAALKAAQEHGNGNGSGNPARVAIVDLEVEK